MSKPHLAILAAHLNNFDESYDKTLEYCLDEETVNVNELLKEDHWITHRSDKEVEKNTSSATRDTRKREEASTDDESRLLKSYDACD